VHERVTVELGFIRARRIHSVPRPYVSNSAQFGKIRCVSMDDSAVRLNWRCGGGGSHFAEKSVLEVL